jgi:hypothetical protein
MCPSIKPCTLIHDHIPATREPSTLFHLFQVEPVDTNIVIVTLRPPLEPTSIQEQLKRCGLLVSSLAAGTIRLVTHLDVGQDAIDWACRVLRGFVPEEEVKDEITNAVY